MLLLRDKTTGPVDGAGGKWSPRMWLNHLTKLCKSTYKFSKHTHGAAQKGSTHHLGVQLVQQKCPNPSQLKR